MRSNVFTFKAKVWLYPGMAAWHFLTLPKKESARIKKTFEGLERGFGSFRVKVIIGTTSWNTSIFPDKKAGAYLLPLKAHVRKKENIRVGQSVEFTVEIQT